MKVVKDDVARPILLVCDLKTYSKILRRCGRLCTEWRRGRIGLAGNFLPFWMCFKGGAQGANHSGALQ